MWRQTRSALRDIPVPFQVFDVHDFAGLVLVHLVHARAGRNGFIDGVHWGEALVGYTFFTVCHQAQGLAAWTGLRLEVLPARLLELPETPGMVRAWCTLDQWFEVRP